MMLTVPQPIKVEHNELHAELEKATKMGGRVGDAAKAVAKLLHPHFVKEEEFALPPLGLLVALSQGNIEPEMADVLAMTDKLEGELPRMLAEHKDIIAALEKLIEAAGAEEKPEQARFAEKLVLHARAEEQVFYPTAILIGRYLKLQLAK
jgi:hypothetical protein